MGEAVDFGYLESFAAGDRVVVDDVLRLFLGQAKAWEMALGAADPAGWSDLVHNIKGTARGIGAKRLGDLAQEAERVGPEHAAELLAELAAATAEIDAYLSTSRE